MANTAYLLVVLLFGRNPRPKTHVHVMERAWLCLDLINVLTDFVAPDPT